MTKTISAQRSDRPRLRNAIQSVSNAFGQLTRNTRTLPDFLLVGAQRGGTTPLFRALKQHPLVKGPTLRRGVHYFDVHYDRGLDFYRGHFPTLSAVRKHGPEGGVRVFESSPYYMFHPLGAERIARDLPWVKVVVALRDPVERAFSAHAHESARGFETEPFERALELESERLEGQDEYLLTHPGARSYSHQHHAYLARGRYAEQLERLERFLGRERIHVVESESLFEDPERHFAALEDFLGLPHHNGVRFDRHSARTRGGVGPALRARLNDHFAPHDERLARWWGRVPHWRR
ncbi:sulfotransferase family protein [Actinorugispora endophytica]|uniref:Sulfotransferase domain-containing protein n=1 Tax=Actinorugispora endophytica TaxID=1605990 RepID=A0A4R6VD02_9ACTN|nr:sulfotransferase [Actinorugispora endophytica]TDQ54857.1 sulfotransferase domain-containing protein [Actinorugispora endophytica]